MKKRTNQNLVNNKKAISGVIVSMILIAFALVVVGIVWYAINNVVKSTSSEIETSSSQLFGSCADAGLFELGSADECLGSLKYLGGKKCCDGDVNVLTGLVSWWSFDVDARDDWGENDGTVNGAVWNATGGHDGKGAYEFDGADDYVAIDNLYYDTLGEISEITICAWVKSSSSNEQIIMSFDRSEYWRFALKDDGGTNNVGWDTRDSADTGNDLRTTTDYADGNWYYICSWFKANDSPNKQIFVNASSVASNTAHDGNNLGVGTVRYGFIGVGSEADTFDGDKGPTIYFNGTIDELRIYHRALSEEEIELLYELG